jgi:hypothetical protein
LRPLSTRRSGSAIEPKASIPTIRTSGMSSSTGSGRGRSSCEIGVRHEACIQIITKTSPSHALSHCRSLT